MGQCTVSAFFAHLHEEQYPRCRPETFVCREKAD